MSRFSNLQIKTNVKRLEALQVLKKNRANHIEIVKEAKIGYIKSAQITLQDKLDQLKQGKTPSLNFNINPPIDYTAVYDKAIMMLEMHSEDTIELESNEFSNLIQDVWDWSNSFYGLNKSYSSTANSQAEQLGY